MLNKEYIKTHSLEECLMEFEGAHGLEKNLTPQFELLARKLLYGGHFEVSSCGELVRKIYLHTIEFYYHEETGPVKDYIMYHRNKEGKGTQIPPFRVGSLNAHQSGIDITFEDFRNGDNPYYRASALVRAFMVKEGFDGSFKEFVQPRKNMPANVEFRSTYLYEYLFMGIPVSDICVQWIQDDLSDNVPIHDVRLRVYLYERDGLKIKPLTQDPRLWSFHRCE